jgi:tyrosine-protein kinase Etk/Wzc
VLLNNRIGHDEHETEDVMKPMLTQSAHGPDDGEIDLSALLHQLWAHKWLLVLTTTLCFALGMMHASKQKAQYQSNVLLQVDARGGVSGGVAQQLLSGGVGGDSAATQIALIQSRFILEPVVELLGLNISVVPQVGSKLKKFFSWSYPPELIVPTFDMPKTEINKAFDLLVDTSGHISLYDADKQLLLSGKLGEELTSSDGRFHLVTENTEFSKDTQFKLIKRLETGVAKALAGALKVEETGGKGRAGGTGVLELSLKGHDKREVLRTLDAIAETARLQDAEKKAQEASQTLNFLHQQLPVTKDLLEKSETSLNQYRAESGKIDIKIQTEFLLKQLADLDKQLGVLRIKSIEMRQQYKKIHPAWIAQDAQIEAVTIQRARLEKELKKLPASDQVAVNLMRDVEVKQALYMLLLNKIQELEVVKAGTVSGVRILSYATLPDAPLPSKRRLIALGSSMLGFMLGVMIILGRKLFSPRVDDPHWSERQLNLPNVAIVPYCKEQGEQGLLSLKSLPLLAQTHPKNLAIEALRSLRTNLQVTLACADNNVIGILGVAPSVGKSFVSANLAYLLAAAGKRVLLIDADLRRGTLHKYFDLKPSPGLAEILDSTIGVEESLKASSHPNLTVLPRGRYPKDPAELLSGVRFKTLTDTFSEQYDVVLLDTAPVLLVTDAVLVGAVAGTNFLVFGAGAHQPSDIELVVRRLQNADVHVNGSIFNFHKEQTRNYYYGKSYNYSDYYHDESEKAEV